MAETVVRYGNGVQTKFFVPGNISRAVYVGGTLVTPSASTAETVTLSVAPGMGVPVEIDYETSTAPIKDGGLGNVVLTGTPSAGQVVVASGGSAAVWATPSFTSTGVPGWAASTVYVVDQRVISPSGRPIVCRIAHTSASTFNATKWVYPGPSDSALIDFRLLPDGNITTVEPVCGWFSHFGTTSAADLLRYGPSNGELVFTSPAANIYAQISLPTSNFKVQHIFCEYIVSAGAPANAGIVLHTNKEDWWTTLNVRESGIHWQHYSNSGGAAGSSVTIGGYGFSDVTAKSYLVPLPANMVNVPIRADIIINQTTGRISGYVNGVLHSDYMNPEILVKMNHQALLQITSDGVKIRTFGCSASIPDWAVTPGNRPLCVVNNDNGIGAVLTSTYQEIASCFVSYDQSGAVELTAIPYLTASSGTVWMDISPSLTVPDSSNQAGYYKQQVAAGVVNSRITCSQIYKGEPGTTQKLALWMRTSGTASVYSGGTYGSNGGLRWRPVYTPGYSS